MLDDKRQKIRLIQQRKISERELVDSSDLPQAIPVTLSIGHRVYTHITRPEEGVFLGTIAAVDPVEHTYRVVFDRSSIGSQTVPDYEIKSLKPIQTIPIRIFMQTYRPKLSTNYNNNRSDTGNNLSSAAFNSPNLHSILLNTPLNRLTPSLNNIFLEDLNNPAIASALMFQTSVDPMLGLLSSPFNLDTNGSLFQTTPMQSTGQF